MAALLSAGALLLGKLATHEIGLGTTGLNTVLGTPRNPHDPGRHTGGSSSGSAAAVAAGLCPLALGSDGGGSVRIPAALCGCVGLKPTHDRLDHSQGPEVDCTVAVLGPLAASVADCQLAYAVMAGARGPGSCAGPHGFDPGPTHPPVRLSAGLPRAGQDLSGALAGKQAGIYWKASLRGWRRGGTSWCVSLVPDDHPGTQPPVRRRRSDVHPALHHTKSPPPAHQYPRNLHNNQYCSGLRTPRPRSWLPAGRLSRSCAVQGWRWSTSSSRSSVTSASHTASPFAARCAPPCRVGRSARR